MDYRSGGRDEGESSGVGTCSCPDWTLGVSIWAVALALLTFGGGLVFVRFLERWL